MKHNKRKQVSPGLILVDILLFILAGWSEFGYNYFSQATAFHTVDYPLQRYLYTHLSENDIIKLSNYSFNLIKFLSYADASLTIATIVNIKKRRTDLVEGLRQGWKELKIYKSTFILNFLFFICIFSGSFSPWVGLLALKKFDRYVNVMGITMYSGQVIAFVLSLSPYIFPAAKKITSFLTSSSSDKWRLLANVFTTKKGIVFAIRTIVNNINNSWRFFGLGLLTARYVFSYEQIRNYYSTVIAISSAYKTIMSQSVEDYDRTFANPNVSINIQKGEIQKSHPTSISSNKILKFIVYPLFLFWLFLAFILRTLSVPSLYTGIIENPKENYGIKETLISIMGIVFGGFASFQYCRYRKRLGDEVLVSVLQSNLLLWRCRKHHHVEEDKISQPLLKDDQSKSYSNS